MSVIIVGGGMAGATLALAISRLSHGALPVHLIEATAPESHAHPGFDGRAIALAAGTCQQLARIGVWQSLADCATAITTVHVSDRGHAGFVTLAAEDYQLAALGQVVELHNVGQRLFALLRKAPGVTLHCPDRVANVARTQSHVEVTLESGETLTGRVLVAADGTHSALATACGVDWQQEPYEQLRLPLRTKAALLNASRNMARWRCCRCLTDAVRWSGVIHWNGAKRCCRGATRSFAVNSSRPLAGDLEKLPTPVNAVLIRWR